MNIDWNSFTPYASLGGGLLIGLAAAVLLLLNGRIAGVSGIVGGVLHKGVSDLSWRFAFIAGLLLAPWIWVLFAPMPAITVSGSPLVLVAAGLLVGVGSRLGSGCTSGHGVCGLARLSVRSLVATLSFMSAAFATVFFMRHLLGAI